MVDIQTLQAASIFVASAGMFIAAVYYVLQIRHQTKIRQTDLVMKLYSTYDSMEFIEAWRKIYFTEFKDYDDFLKKFGGKREIAIFVFRFFEEVGVLLRKKLIDIALVDELFGNNVKMTWEKTKDTILEDARRRVNPRAYENFEYLYNEMKRREQKIAKTQ